MAQKKTKKASKKKAHKVAKTAKKKATKKVGKRSAKKRQRENGPAKPRAPMPGEAGIEPRVAEPVHRLARSPLVPHDATVDELPVPGAEVDRRTPPRKRSR
jgi:hypothetical protein